MKKIVCLFLIGFCTVMFSACGITINKYEETLFEGVIYVRIPETVFDTPGEYNNLMREITDHIKSHGDTTAEPDSEKVVVETETFVIPIKITIQKVKSRTEETRTTLFFRYRKTTIFNPLSLVKTLDGVEYYYGLQLSYRSTNPNATKVTHNNSKYQYFWISKNPEGEWQNTDIIFEDTFANTPTYYILAIILAGAVCTAIYCGCKYKKRTDEAEEIFKQGE